MKKHSERGLESSLGVSGGGLLQTNEGLPALSGGITGGRGASSAYH